MDSREELHAILKEASGIDNVYFQPPESFQMTYPCVVYTRDADITEHANNKLYLDKMRYQVTVMDRDPDSVIPNHIRKLPYCSFSRHYQEDNLNHDVFTLYY